MPKRITDYQSTLLEALKNSNEAAHYLSAALRDSPEMFFDALRDVAEAHQMSRVAEDAGVSRESLYRMLTPNGNPTSRNLFSILAALDIEFEGVRSRDHLPSPKPNAPGSQANHEIAVSASPEAVLGMQQADNNAVPFSVHGLGRKARGFARSSHHIAVNPISAYPTAGPAQKVA